MALFDKFLKRKKKEIPQEAAVALQSEKTDVGEPVQAEEVKPKKAAVKSGDIIAGVLRTSHITEKTSVAASENKYTFRVYHGANKVLVKRTVEARYGVTVTGVNVLNTHGKERRRGRQVGWKPGFKKVIVTLQKGESIEVQ